MRNRNVFSSLSMIAAATSISGIMSGPAGVSLAQAGEYRGTEAQQLACTPDVFRFCGSQIPDVDRIVVCLRQNMTSLSGGCRAVFEAEARMQQPDRPDGPTVAGKPQRAAPPKTMRAPPPVQAPLPARPVEPDDDDE